MSAISGLHLFLTAELRTNAGLAPQRSDIPTTPMNVKTAGKEAV
jgi:hypothetical protein